MNSYVTTKFIKQLLDKSSQEDIEKVIVGGVICKSNKLLLLERKSSDFMGGLVELPSGEVDKGEDLLNALFREVKEETGLNVKSVISYIGSFNYTSGSGKKTRQFNFLVEVEDGKIILEPDEHQDYHLLSSSDKQFDKLNISDETKAVIHKAFSEQ